MGIKVYNPYTPSRRNMTGLDFDVITTESLRSHFLHLSQRQQDVTIRVRLQLDIMAAETDRSTES